MPSWAIHVSSVTYCSPLAPVLKSAIRTIVKASASRAPSSVIQRAARPAKRPRTPAASGSQSRMERCRVIRSGRLDQEVQAHADQAEEHECRVHPQEAGLQAADGGRGGLDDGRGPADERAVDEDPLERLLAEAPDPGERADEERLVELVEVPLVDEEAVQEGEALLQAGAPPPGAPPQRVGGGKAPAAAGGAPPRA